MAVREKYQLLLTREQQFARMVALRVVEKPEISAWLIVAPLYFIFFWHRFKRYQNAVETFARELVFTKKTALDAAYDMARNGLSREEALRVHFPEPEDGFADREIGRRQRREIEFLIDHYLRLLRAEGETHEMLLKNAYRNRAAYLEFLKGLQEVEKEVNRAAMRVFSHAEDFAETMASMETATETLRMQEAQKTFPEAQSS